MSGRPNVFAHLFNAFRQGLNEVGFVEVETSYSSIARPVTSTTVFVPWPTIWFAEADRIPQRRSLGAIRCAPVSAGPEVPWLFAAPDCLIPPRAHAGREPVVALDDMHGVTYASLGGGHAGLTAPGAHLRVPCHWIMAPQATAPVLLWHVRGDI